MNRLVAGAALALLASAAAADTTVRYTVQHSGRTSGALTTVVGGDGRVRVSYSYRDNGRGPDIEEDFRVGADGTLAQYRLSGKSTFGAALDEHFELARGRAS